MKLFKVLFSLMMFAITSMMIGGAIASSFGTDPAETSLAVASVTLIPALFTSPVQGMALEITYSPLVVVREYFEEIFFEILYLNDTVGKGLVRFEENIKANTTVTEMKSTITLQSYTKKGTPSIVSGDGVTAYDITMTPVKLDAYDEFTMEDLRGSRFTRDMAPGAFNNVSNEFQQAVLAMYGPKIALQYEALFWNGATSATKTAVAALTAGTGQTAVGAAEKTYVAAATTSLFDGVVTKLIYNSYYGSAAVGKRYKVAGTTVSSSNIGDEYKKVYEKISPKLLQGDRIKDLVIFAPLSHRQFITVFNLSQTYRDVFTVDASGYKYLGVRIEFVPLPENCLIAGNAMNILWGCDLMDDYSSIEIKKLPDPDHALYMRATGTIEAGVFNQADFVLYLG